MNTVFTTSIFLCLVIAAVSPVFSHPRPRKMHNNEMMNSRNREREMYEASNNVVDGYDQEVKEILSVEEIFSTSCVFYDYKKECHNSNDGCEHRYIQCPASIYGERPACFNLWVNGMKRLQGCWASGETCKQECKDEQMEGSLNFCCCLGDNCNEGYGHKNVIPEIRQ